MKKQKKLKNAAKICGKILLVILFLSPVLISLFYDMHYNRQCDMKQLVEIVQIDSTVSKTYIPSAYIELGSVENDVTSYSVVYEDSCGILSEKVIVSELASRPKLGPAQIIIEDGRIVWLKAQ